MLPLDLHLKCCLGIACFLDGGGIHEAEEKHALDAFETALAFVEQHPEAVPAFAPFAQHLQNVNLNTCIHAGKVRDLAARAKQVSEQAA